ncbi:hypothetical protein TTHERM_00312590 (macronuclear) [Tetrahymena thermophila SB210]|uniref:Uncharacterized protein n=1 Tax=Tetrahymena thermophila (strain SB210) TaxID=312017 RepID=Q22KM2_TETTS|nr:hypothetical protein TTHERM_00312590 [Tetrahymena thermophila SB210]EAR85777.2 hypothetical protein TTHERM_00312590 [Tetrahymena thermophila SB210]|eukprot:XP_001033440.2 hypothetical protein TTHERM_00312590 [Tetrahymena thermophila SB210]
MDRQCNQQNQSQNQTSETKKNISQEIEDYSEDISRISSSEEDQGHLTKKKQKSCGSRPKSQDLLKKYEDDIIFLKRSLCCRFQKDNKQTNIEWIKQQIDQVNKTQKLEPRFEILSKTFDTEDQIFEYLNQSCKKLFVQFFVHIDNNLQNSQQLYQKLKESLAKSKDRKKEDEHNVINHFKILFEKYHYDFQEFKNAFRKQFPDLYQIARNESYQINTKTQMKNIQDKSTKLKTYLDRQKSDPNCRYKDDIYSQNKQQNNIFNKLTKERQLSYQAQPQKKQKKINQEFDTSFSANKSNQQDDFIEQNEYFDEISKINNFNYHSRNEYSKIQYSNERDEISEQDSQETKRNQQQEDQSNQDYGFINNYQINQAEQNSNNFEKYQKYQANQENQSQLQNKYQLQNQNLDNTYQNQQLNNQRENFVDIDQEIEHKDIIINQFSNSSINRILKNIPEILSQTEIPNESNTQNEQNYQNKEFQTCQCLEFRQQLVKQLESNLSFLQKTSKILKEQLNQIKISQEKNYIKLCSQQNIQQALNSQVLQYDDQIFRLQNNIIERQNQKNTNKFYSQKNLLNNQ